jgi:xylulokinase
MCLTYLRDQVFFAEDGLSTGGKPENAYQLFDQVVAGVPAGSRGVIFTPWLYGERAPVEDHTVRGGFFNQSLMTSRGDLLRAAYEGIAFNSRWLLGNIEKFTGRRMDPIRIVGGGAKSAIWCQIYADVLDRTILQMCDPINSNMVGAAMLAGVALGYLRVEEIPSRVEVAHTYTPDGSHRAIYDQHFSEFVRLYHSLKPIYARLNRTEG